MVDVIARSIKGKNEYIFYDFDPEDWTIAGWTVLNYDNDPDDRNRETEVNWYPHRLAMDKDLFTIEKIYYNLEYFSMV